MGQYSIKVEKSAQKELQSHYKSGDQTVIKKIEQIFEELLEHPLSGTGRPEMLKHKLTGMWSRRINREHRIFMRSTDTKFLFIPQKDIIDADIFAGGYLL